MMKLLKYEFRKAASLPLILLTIIAVLEGLFLYTLYGSGSENSVVLSTALLLLAGIFSVIALGAQSVFTLHHDMNTKQGYMLFMTPHSTYAFLGAKAIECLLMITFGGAVCFALGVLDASLIMKKFGQIQSLIDMFRQVSASFSDLISQLGYGAIAALLLSWLLSWAMTLMVAFLSDILASTLLNGKKLGGLLSFAFFIVITVVLTKLVGLIPVTGKQMTDSLLSSGIDLVLAAIFYFISARVMARHLSV